MAADVTPGREVALVTDRLLLRPWRVGEAAVQRELWTERDPRVPPHRRIDAKGHPTVAELEEAIRADQPSSTGLLAVERKAPREVIGYCGLIESGRAPEGEPELAYAERARRLQHRHADRLDPGHHGAGERRPPHTTRRPSGGPPTQPLGAVDRAGRRCPRRSRHRALA